MVEREFEAGLERMFGQSPTFADADAFTRKVETRLNRDWRLRTFGLGAAGVIGGVVAATQTIGAGLFGRLQHFSVSSASAADNLYHDALERAGVLTQAGSGVSIFWIVSGLMILTAVVGATRAFDEL
jgi:hypothetical protein